jgi:beta-phosphoglucomutase-like phosphatase (HAD superfamily)
VTTHPANAGLHGLVDIGRTSDARFRAGAAGVVAVKSTGDGKVEFVEFGTHTLAHVVSTMGYPAYYPVHPVEIRKPVEAVLMDLDGTTVHSESFWIWIIERSVASLLGDPDFRLEASDLPHVSGHSVSEHLRYCLSKYAPKKTVEEARAFYFHHTRHEMREILEGRGREGAFTPAPGVGEFLLALKKAGIKIGLVTSGLHEKAWPEIVSAFHDLGLGDPSAFYDACVTAGFPIRRGSPGTLGELSPKPHPWLYAETARVGLGIPFDRRGRVVGIEDSAAGICSVRLAGFAAIGLAGGNIESGGTLPLCRHFCRNFDEILAHIL